MKKYIKFLYYHWVAKHVVTQVGNNARQVDHCIFQHVPSNFHSLKFTTIAYTTTIDQNLEWEEFAKKNISYWYYMGDTMACYSSVYWPN